jgi:peptidoglycan/LPS O-acetylase OafA/YrhL
VPVAAATPTPVEPATPLAESTAPASEPRTDGFRTDLEGLRGIAVVLVLLFHAGLPFVTGGYVGVDVFFVLSGFLITGLLVRELEGTGTVSLVSFYARRARRLLPAAALCLLVTVAVAALVLPPLRVPDVSADGIAAALYVSNLRFAFEATDYLASEAAPSPLLHYWSLGVEEQFYLVWPALLLLVARGGGRVVRRVAIAAVVVGVASLGLSLWLTAANAPWAFYSLPTRAWELGIGALLAVRAARFVRMPARFATAALWGGLALIAVSAVVIGTSTPFPGIAALLPTAGAALVILAGSVPSGARARSPLDVPPLRFLGRISYSLYLWHWPLLILPAAALGTVLPLQANLALAVLAIPIAAASQRWVEDPIRRGTFVGVLPRRNLAMAGAMTLVLVVSVASFGQSAVDRLAGATADGVQGEADVEDLIEEVSVAAQHSGNATAAPTRAPATLSPTTSPERFAGPVPANLAPALIDVRADRPLIYDDGCHLGQSDRVPGECVFGDRGSATTVVLMGDSHAAQWFPALDALGREQRWRLVSMTKSGCPPAEATIWVGGIERAYTECDAWREAVFERIAQLRPDLVVVSMTYGQTPIVDGETLDGPPARKVMVKALERTLEHLDTIAVDVALIADTPRAPDDPPVCLSSNLDDALSCATARDTAVESDYLEAQAEVAREAGVTFVDPTPWVCPTDPCPAVIGRYLVYRDTHHLTTAYAMAVRGRLSAALPVPAVRRVSGE